MNFELRLHLNTFRRDALLIFMLIFVFTFFNQKAVFCWHDLDNTEYDCWPVDQPNEHNMIDCLGLSMAWIVRPPEKVVSGKEFNVTYSLTVNDQFYEKAVKAKIFQFRTAGEAQAFCEDMECPLDWKDATEENCCVYHANIHSCPLSFMKQSGICGPWIPDDGKIVTHTVSQAGKMTQYNWTSKVVLINLGVTSLIAHIKVGTMQAALESKSTVLSAQVIPPRNVATVPYETTIHCLKQEERVRNSETLNMLKNSDSFYLQRIEAVCGDNICSPDEGCSLCPADCGPCPMSTSIKIAVGLPLALFFSGFVFGLVWFLYQKQKMLWDESWIINVKDMQGSDFQNEIGSVISLQQNNNNAYKTLRPKFKANTVLTCSSSTDSIIQTGI